MAWRELELSALIILSIPAFSSVHNFKDETQCYHCHAGAKPTARTCYECHDGTQALAVTMSHPLTGNLTCLSCHLAHDKGEGMTIKNCCSDCHPDKAGSH